MRAPDTMPAAADATRAATDATGAPHGGPAVPRAPRTAAPALLAAALALPGVHPDAVAQAPPERAQIDVRWLHCQDAQPGLKRIRVDSPFLGLRVPAGERGSFDGSIGRDPVSGASPRWHSAVSGASRMHDERTAGDLRVTRHWDRATLTFGGAASSENDCRSRALSLRGTWSSDDNNRTWSAGVGRADERIDPVQRHRRERAPPHDRPAARRHAGADPGRRGAGDADARARRGLLLGPLQGARPPAARARADRAATALEPPPRLARLDAATRLAALRRQLERALAHADRRVGAADGAGPDADALAALLHAERGELLLRAGLRPGARRAVPAGLQRRLLGDPLSAFGAGAIGLRVSKAIDRSSLLDFRLEHYERRGAWRIGGAGTEGLAPLRATIFQIGLTHLF
jgi:hypothetical protein